MPALKLLTMAKLRYQPKIPNSFVFFWLMLQQLRLSLGLCALIPSLGQGEGERPERACVNSYSFKLPLQLSNNHTLF